MKGKYKYFKYNKSYVNTLYIKESLNTRKPLQNFVIKHVKLY